MPTEIDADIELMLLDDEHLQRFCAQLCNPKRRTASLEQVWQAFLSVYGDVPPGRERRLWLRLVLDELDGSDEIILPVAHGRQWDRSSDIHLPTRIRFPASISDQPTIDWRSYAWNPQLEWILDRRHVSRPQIEFLLQINRGLREGWFQTRESLKYRSLQLTGDEKRLAKYAKTRLFGPQRLSLHLLGCEPEFLPVAMERISDDATMLMFENAAPFIAARRTVHELLETGTSLKLGAIAYGAGKQVIKSATYLSLVRPCVAQVVYVGDLDVEGLQIASDLRRVSPSGICIIPATKFHEAMIESARELEAPGGWPAPKENNVNVPTATLAFLDSRLQAACQSLIAKGRRIPEEALSAKWMRTAMMRTFGCTPDGALD